MIDWTDCVVVAAFSATVVVNVAFVAAVVNVSLINDRTFSFDVCVSEEARSVTVVSRNTVDFML